MRVELIRSPNPRCVERVCLELPAGATVESALRASGWQVSGAGVGVWGRRCTLQHPLHEGDRVELYRPLEVDPKEARRARDRSRAGAPTRR